MGKIRIVGRAKREYQPDLCHVYLNVQNKKRTTDIASKQTNNQCEKLLSDLIEKGFGLENIVISEDTVRQDREYGYRSSDDSSKELLYEAVREIRLTVPAEQKILNIISDIIENGYKNITISKHFIISNEPAYLKELQKEAVEDSRTRANYFAEMMGQKIAGIDSANLSDGDDYDDPVNPDRIFRKCMADSSQRPLSDKLEIEPLQLEAEVNIVWLIDNDDKTPESGA